MVSPRRRIVGALALGAVLATAGLNPTGAATDGARVRLKVAHTVRQGENLTTIAKRYGVTVASVRDANRLHGDHLEVGQPLTVVVTAEPTAARHPVRGDSRADGVTAPAPPPAEPAAAPAAASGPGAARAGDTVVHVVRPGETLSTIATMYGASVDALARLNDVRNRNRVKEGARLRVPAPERPNLPLSLRRRPERMALIPLFERWAGRNGLAVDLVMATAYLESGWDNAKVSSVGAIGIGQLMPDTAVFIATDLIGERLDPQVPEHNIRMSARFLRYLLGLTGGDVETALCGYYQGLRSMRVNGIYPETRQYAASVLALRSRFRKDGEPSPGPAARTAKAAETTAAPGKGNDATSRKGNDTSLEPTEKANATATGGANVKVAGASNARLATPAAPQTAARANAEPVPASARPATAGAGRRATAPPSAARPSRVEVARGPATRVEVAAPAARVPARAERL